MEIKIIEKFNDENIEMMQNTKDNEIIIDLELVKYLSSKEITKLLVISRDNKKLKLKNVNEYIKETIKVLKLEDILILSP